MRIENIIYVGIDLHKETHTAVMLDCWNQKLQSGAKLRYHFKRRPVGRNAPEAGFL